MARQLGKFFEFSSRKKSDSNDELYEHTQCEEA